MTTAERFWSHVDRRGGNDDCCWRWTAARDRRGYGRFGPERGQTVFAHRFAFQLECGPIPDGFCVLHRCDNPACVNPDHLWLGDRAANHFDMVQKGRARAGRIGLFQTRKAACPNGHPYTPENTISRPSKPAHRDCRACHNARRRRARPLFDSVPEVSRVADGPSVGTNATPDESTD